MKLSKTFLFGVLAFVIALFFLFVCGELTVRVFGYKRWHLNPSENLKVIPGNKLYQKDAQLGYQLIPGEYRIAYPSYSFTATHSEDSHRATEILEKYRADSRPEIWVFGCSYTYGWSLSDADTFPWKLQQKLSGYKVVNWGVPGYGNVHSLIQFNEAIQSGKKPALAIFTYGSFHDERNVFSRSRRKAVVPWNKLGPVTQPFCRLDTDGGIRFITENAEYSLWPFMQYSALIHFLEIQYDRFELYLLKSHEVSERVFQKINESCEKNGVPCLVAGIAHDQATADLLDKRRAQGSNVLDISVDFNDRSNVNLPYDLSHPSARATEAYASKLAEFLKQHYNIE